MHSQTSTCMWASFSCWMYEWALVWAPCFVVREKAKVCTTRVQALHKILGAYRQLWTARHTVENRTPGPLQEQYVLLATKLPLQPWTLTFCSLMLSNASIPRTFEECLCLLNLGFCVKSTLKPNLKFYLYNMFDVYIYEFMWIHDVPPASPYSYIVWPVSFSGTACYPYSYWASVSKSSWLLLNAYFSNEL